MHHLLLVALELFWMLLSLCYPHLLQHLETKEVTFHWLVKFFQSCCIFITPLRVGVLVQPTLVEWPRKKCLLRQKWERNQCALNHHGDVCPSWSHGTGKGASAGLSSYQLPERKDEKRMNTCNSGRNPAVEAAAIRAGETLCEMALWHLQVSHGDQQPGAHQGWPCMPRQGAHEHLLDWEGDVSVHPSLSACERCWDQLQHGLGNL